MFLGGKKPPQTVVRKVTVVEKKEPNLTRHSNSSPSVRSQSLKYATHRSSPSSRTGNQRTSSPLFPGASGLSKPPRSQKSLKRKQPSPSVQYPNFSSDDDSSDEEVVSNKRFRSTSDDSSTSLGRDQSHDNRQVFRIALDSPVDAETVPMINGGDIVSGDYAKEYKSDIFGSEAAITAVSVQYPSRYPAEPFYLVSSKEKQGIDPIAEVTQSVEMMCTYYFAPEESLKLLDDDTGIVRQLKRAFRDGALEQFADVLNKFGTTIRDAITDGRIANTVQHIHRTPLPLVESILNQVYSRTVSPRVNKLKQYENGTSNVYGELLPKFTHTIFKDTNLRSDHVFVDLGSGVGNVALHAALEIGCESWGIEQMPNPADLGHDQAKEFEARCKRWSIHHGKVTLLKGDFLASLEIDAAIRRADVILINNQAFTPELNDNIVMKLLDVKEGGRIVSLKSFVPAGWEIKQRNFEDPRNLLKVVKKQYWSNSVSWTAAGGEYYVATIDSSRLRKFQEALK